MRTVYYTIILLSAIVGFAVSTQVNECDPGVLIPEEVNVTDCDSEKDLVCFVKFNGIIEFTMKFKTPHYLESIKPNLIGKTAYGNFNLTLQSDLLDACLGVTNSVCPLVQGESIEFKYSVKLLVLPLLPVTLEFSIVDTDLNEDVLCFSLDVFPAKL